MGGRGVYSTSYDEYMAQKELREKAYEPDTKYNHTTSNKLPAGVKHAFFDGQFTIITYSTEDDPDSLGLLPEHTFGQDKPAVRWCPMGR